jgi:nucleotide-binding universal stress UspA family protein
MYQKILFAVGDDAASDAAVPVVAAYARHLKADLHVLHVHRAGEDAPNGQIAMLDRVVERLEAGGVHASGEVRLSRNDRNLPDIITRAVMDTESDLVAIGSRGRSDLGGLFLGSVSHRVAAGLDLPVLVIRTTPGLHAPPRTVLVATDGSAASDRAVADAAELARRTGAAVSVLHVSEIMTTPGGAFVESETEAEAIINQAVALLQEQGIHAKGETVISQTGSVDAIAGASERDGADLIVIASRRPSELSGLLLGSVAHGLIHRLSKPVLLASRIPARAQPAVKPDKSRATL